MNKCLIHQQEYPQSGFCVYCGDPAQVAKPYQTIISPVVIPAQPTWPVSPWWPYPIITSDRIDPSWQVATSSGVLS